MKRFPIYLMVIAMLSLTTSCGGGGGGSSSSGIGSGLNIGFDLPELTCEGTVTGGTFESGDGASVYVADGVLSPCVNAMEDPTISAVTVLPDAFDFDSSEGDVNVTSNGVGYEFDIKGETGFITNESGAVTITLPFDSGAVPSANSNSTMVFIRLLDTSNNNVVEMSGEISGSSVTVETRGLPAEFTAAVIYNPNMRAVTAGSSGALIISGKADPNTWSAQNWCIVYNKSASFVVSAIQQRLVTDGTINPGDTPSDAQIVSTVETYVVDNADSAQGSYEAAGFDDPNLIAYTNSSGPCSGELGSTARYLLRLTEGGAQYTQDYAGEPISPNGLKYGRMFINPSQMNDSASVAAGQLGTIMAAIAHEMLHAVQQSYVYYGWSSAGFAEATATTYGTTLDQSGTISVRSYTGDETMLLSDFFGVATMNFSGISVKAYAGQDFFAYLARQYGNNSLSFVADMYDQIGSDVTSNASAISDIGDKSAYLWQPPFSALYSAIDASFRSALGLSLKDAYMDFLRQRAFDHNNDSRFGRNDETVSGFAEDLFETSSDSSLNSFVTVSVNADDCSISNATGTFSDIASYASRAIKIEASTPSSASTGPTIAVVFDSEQGTIGSDWMGYSMQSGNSNLLSAAGDSFSDFGRSSSDEIHISIANVMNSDDRKTISYTVTCNEGEGGGGDDEEDTPSTFGVTSLDLGDFSFTPAWVETTAYSDGSSQNLITKGYEINLRGSTTTLDLGWAYLTLNADYISGTGTYNFGSDSETSAAYITVTPDSTETTVNPWISTEGTLTLTEWSYEESQAGEDWDLDPSNRPRVRGSYTVTLERQFSPREYGSMEASFNLGVNQEGSLE